MIGQAVLAIWLDVDPAGLEDFNAWYRRQHVPERLSVVGFLRGRRYQATGDGPPYFTLYETEAGALSSPAYLERLNAPTDWTRRALPLVRRMVRNACRRIAVSAGDATAGHLLTVRIQPHAGRGPAVRTWLAGEGVAAVRGLAGVAACGFYESDTGGTSVVTEERRLVGGEVAAAPPFLALCEVSDADRAADLAGFWRTWATKIAADVTADGYRLMYGLAWITP